MKITKVLVIKTEGADIVILYTNLPGAIWPFKENMCLRFDAAADTGEKYIKDNLPEIEDIEIVNRYTSYPKIFISY